MEELQLEHTTGKWMLFTDSPTVSLTAVLLPSNPLAHAIHMKGTYKNLQVLLQKIHYEEHQWNICADLKVMAMLTVLQGG